MLGLILIALTAFFLIGEGESPPPRQILNASGVSQVAESNKLPPPVEIPPVGIGRKVIVQPEISKKDSPTESTQREKESTGTEARRLEQTRTEQKEKSSKNAEEDKSPDEKSSESDSEAKKPTLVKKRACSDLFHSRIATNR